jgi:hypothetical protein
MKNETEAIPTANVKSSPVVTADGLKVSYTVTVTTDTGQNAFTVRGGFDLPSALHRVRRSRAEEDFEMFLTRCVVNNSSSMLSMFMYAIEVAEHKNDFVQNLDDPGAPKLNAPSSQPGLSPVALEDVLKVIPGKYLKPQSADVPANAGRQLVAA